MTVPIPPKPPNPAPSPHESILLSLSGGFDSAVVLGCIEAHLRKSLTCFNLFGDNPREDERHFAQIAAKNAEARLVEVPQHSTAPVFDERQFDFLTGVKPSIPALFKALNLGATNNIAESVHANAVWTGQGGDHLFWQLREVVTAADFVSRHGIARGLFSAVSDAARLSRQSYVSVLQAAIRLGRTKTPWVLDSAMRRPIHFVNPAALPDNLLEYTAHPWGVGGEDLPKGKQLQCSLLGELLNRHRPVPRVEYAYEHHPLLSQPLIEICLQIPTYLLVQGGRQRALARDAFSDCVPVEILRREDKGDITIAITDMIRESERFICEILGDGVLAQERIIDFKKLEPYLLHRQSLRDSHIRPLLACIAAEIWARTWTGNTLKAAA